MLMASTMLFSLAHTKTSWPFRAQCSASAVPHAPPPKTDTFLICVVDINLLFYRLSYLHTNRIHAVNLIHLQKIATRVRENSNGNHLHELVCYPSLDHVPPPKLFCCKDHRRMSEPCTLTRSNMVAFASRIRMYTEFARSSSNNSAREQGFCAAMWRQKRFRS